MKRADVIFNVLRVPVDGTLLAGAGMLVYILRTRILDTWWPVQFSVELPFARFFWLVVGVSVCTMLVYAIAGLYAMRLRMSRLEEMVRILLASSVVVMATILFIFLRQELFNSRFLVVGYWGLATALVMIGRLTLRSVRRMLLVRRGWGAHRVLLIGEDVVTDRLASDMAEHPELGWSVAQRLRVPDMDGVIAAIRDGVIDEVMLANPHYSGDAIVDLVDYCHERHIAFKFVPNIYQTLAMHYDVDAIGQIPVVELRRTALDGWGRVFKRLVDMIGATVALIILSPVFAGIALAIKWETAGPILVRLRRVSGTREFYLYKFRSMIENAEELKPMLAAYNERADGPLFKMRKDPRITPVGSVLRRYRLDELPQFLNVFWGDISLIGPRPHQPDEVARYEKHHRKVLGIKAGATGLAQVSGSSDLPFEEEVALDTFYIENWSLWLDLRIFAKTVGKVLGDHSAV